MPGTPQFGPQGPLPLVTVAVPVKLGDVVDVSGIVEATTNMACESTQLVGFVNVCWKDSAGNQHNSMPFRFDDGLNTPNNLLVPAGSTFTVSAATGGAGTYQISICGQVQSCEAFTAFAKGIKVIVGG
jgi:hypothetical protein